MKKTDNIIRYAGLTFMTGWMFASCSLITQFPDENAVDPTLVNLRVNLTIDSEAADMTDTDLFDHGVVRQRVVVEAYKFDNSSKPVIRKDVIPDGYLTKDKPYTVDLSLNSTKYRIVVWSDYVQTAAPADTYYYTAETLRKVKYNGVYVGNKQEKDCFSAWKDIDLTEYRDEWNITADTDIDLKRPVGKLIVMTNDVDGYISRVESRGDAISRTDINAYTARVTYSGFTPNGFDAYSAVLNDAVPGLTFESNLTLVEDNKAMISFDYVLGDCDGTAYSVDVKIFDEDGKVINDVGGRNTEVWCDRITVLEADFLTGDYEPGISIDTDFDGVIDVPLPE